MYLSAPLTLLILTLTTTARKTPERVLLSNIKSLTLRNGLQTTHNRVPPLPQLSCVGGSAKNLYEVDTLRCKNAGSGYDDNDVQWTCTASLPSEFKLGSTDVICEGFAGPDDPYVLKGSCGVEYRLVLTELGEEKYGRKNENMWEGYKRSKAGNWAAVIFWIAFVIVVGWMVYAAFIRDNPRRAGGRGLGFGGFGGGGGGGGDNDDPPPPYDYRAPPKPKASTSTRGTRGAPAQAQEGWRPGFWSGALGGAAAGYMAGGRRNQTQQPRNQGLFGGRDQGYGYDSGEGSSSWGGGRTRPSGSSSSSFGSSRHESSGFGSTSRR